MRILVADDDPAALLLLRDVLDDWGYEVTAVPDGVAAWDVLRRADAPPLALIDWMMPGLDGVEVCRKIRQAGEAPFIYLVLLTIKDTTEDVVHGIESGADDYVSKPFNKEELRVRLRAGQRIVELHQALLAQATHDSLTGIWNRKAIVDILKRELARAMRDGNSVSVIMADIDHFKRLNDTRGHRDGDAALREVARRLGASLRPSDSLGRYGGEEFLIVLPGCDLSGAVLVAERMRQVIAEADVTTPTGRTSLTLSLGVATSKGLSLDAEELIRLADEALYRAKDCGRNRVEPAIDLSNIASSNDADAQARADLESPTVVHQRVSDRDSPCSPVNKDRFW